MRATARRGSNGLHRTGSAWSAPRRPTVLSGSLHNRSRHEAIARPCARDCTVRRASESAAVLLLSPVVRRLGQSLAMALVAEVCCHAMRASVSWRSLLAESATVWLVLALEDRFATKMRATRAAMMRPRSVTSRMTSPSQIARPHSV